MLWGDEAETALLAASIVEHGVPRATDGKNSITLLNGGDWNEDEIWVWSPWLDEYVAAISFRVFGKTTWAARFPFAIFALLSVVYLVWLAFRIYRRHEIAITVGVFVSTCVPFLLHARQCRYYGIVVLAQVLFLHGFYGLLSKGFKRGALFIGVALVVQFYCNYIVVPGNVLGLAVGFFLCGRSLKFFFAVSGAVAGLVLFAVPWLLYASPGSQLGTLQLSSVVDILLHYFGLIQFYVFPVSLLFLLLGVRFFGRSTRPEEDDDRKSRMVWFLLGLAVAQVLALGIAPFAYFRYLLPTIPGLCLLGAIGVGILPSVWLRRALVSFLCLTNGVALATGFFLPGSRSFDAPYPLFARSLFYPYEDRLERVVEYLREEGDSSQSVYVSDPSFPLIFYTDMKIVDARYHPISPDDLPDWILSVSPSAADAPATLSLPPKLLKRYEPVVLQVPKTRWGASRPDPIAHVFLTADETEEWVAYRKKEPARD